METQKDRLLFVLRRLHIGQGRFECWAGVGRGSISKSRGELSPVMLEKIASAVPTLNMEWLCSGEGTMFLPAEADTDSRHQQIAEEIAAQQAVIVHLCREIERAQHAIAKAQEEIVRLTAEMEE